VVTDGQDRQVSARDEVVEITRDLIRIDTSNWGASSETVGEAEAADYCAQRLIEVGYEPEVVTTTSDTRRGVVLRIPGLDSERGALVLHGHLDVVPAVADEWSHPPFAAEVEEGFIWGRGAVDMKNMDAMMLAIVRDWKRTNYVPPRDVILAYFPDEEAGMVHGSQWITRNRPELFAGASEAVGEVGGFSVQVDDRHRLYPIQTAEKGIRWLQLHAQARAGHGSLLHPDNAVSNLAAAVARIGSFEWPMRSTQTVSAFLDQLSEVLDVDVAHADVDEILSRLGTLGLLIGATMQNTANPTMLNAGYKVNVIPREATAGIDGRVLPGFEDEFDATIAELVGPDVDIEVVNSDIALEAPLNSNLLAQMGAALHALDPAAIPIPYMISGGTDAKALSTLGITCYGFSPLRLPPDLDYWRMFHGVDERVPVDGLMFGTDVLDDFLRNC
jgi:acetylornithine deacetylase/succinyl-diaminopimelate desuccinylase-like protein